MKKLLLGLVMCSSAFCAQAQTALSEGFEGTTFPPTGWSVINTNPNPTKNWMRSTSEPISGTASAVVPYDGADISDESLVTPAFSLVGYPSAYLMFNAVLGYTWMVDPNPNGDLFVEVSTNGGTTWGAPIWVEDQYGEYEDYDVLRVKVNLAAYIGQANVKVRFRYNAFDADTVRLDDVIVSSCGEQIDALTLTALSDTGYTITWTSGAGVDVEYGPYNFAQGTGTVLTNVTSGTFSQSDLTPGTGYTFYLRPNCGTSQGGWEGPYNIFTTLSATAVPDYEFGFETGTLPAGGWSAVRVVPNSGAIWGLTASDEDAEAYDGEQFVAAGAFTVGDSYLFSRALDLTAGTPYQIKYYQREIIFAGNGGTNNVAVKIHTNKTVTEWTALNPIVAIDNVDDTDWALKTATFTPATSGTYYVGFHYTCPQGGQVQANFGYAAIDAFVVDNTLSVEDDLIGAFFVQPNPASDVISVRNSTNILVNAITMTDLNGRVVKRNMYSDLTSVEVNVSDLSAGMYLMNIETDRGAVTKKIVKK